MLVLSQVLPQRHVHDCLGYGPLRRRLELDAPELEALIGEISGNAVPVEAVVRNVARCVAGVC